MARLPWWAAAVLGVLAYVGFHWLAEKPFLTAFTKAVKDNLHAQRLDPDSMNQRLSSYYTMSRTTNDQQSLAGRYDILSKAFEEYVGARK